LAVGNELKRITLLRLTVANRKHRRANDRCVPARRHSFDEQRPAVKISSMPMNSPITHKPDNGHCLQIMIPSTRVTIPFKSTQNEFGAYLCSRGDE
jgi:hypothetical protein